MVRSLRERAANRARNVMMKGRREAVLPRIGEADLATLELLASRSGGA